METPQIPSQLFYKIGQVSHISGIKAHVLRYWEAEFGLIKPRKDRKGQRLYRQRDIDIILRIKELLHEKHYSIRGAKQKLKEELSEEKSDKKASIPDLRATINQHKKQIKELMDLIAPEV